MEETLKLKNPIKIDDKEVSELKYDLDEIDDDLYIEAEKTKTKMAAGAESTVYEFDRMAQKFIGYAAIIAVNRKLDFSDLRQIKGTDIGKVISIGRRFFFDQEDSAPKD